MSLLTPPPPTPPSKEILLNRQVESIKNLSVESYNIFTRIQKRGIDMVWNHPTLTPQEIIDAMGDEAIKVFQYHGALTNYLVSLAQAEGIAPNIKLPNNAFVIDQQAGTITVTEDPYVP